MTRPQINLQDSFLNQVRKDQVHVTIYLVNGFQIKGLVKGFDNFTVVMDSDGKQLLVYKHAISTITPARPVVVNTAAAESRRESPDQ
ncbi:MAG: RNA chaperone Hfq [Firmicutes bacterium]|jgi:host factor-I protein|nr:RNA chaperone Hfq [Bacillota bacterium]